MNNTLLHKQIEVTMITPLPTGDFQITSTDLKTNKPFSWVLNVEDSKNARIYAPGFFFSIQYFKHTASTNVLSVEHELMFTDKEDCLFSNWNTRGAMHGYEIEKVATAPRNTFNYYVPAAPQTKQFSKPRGGRT